MNGGLLEGRTSLITGGGRGLGLEIARAYAQHGADLILASRKVDQCERAAEQITSETGRRAIALGCHVGRWADCDKLVEQVYERCDRLDILVNNAGMSPVYPSLDAVTEELFDKVIAVNLKGPFRLSSLVAPRMQADGGGSIINISSVAAVQPRSTEAPYAAAKAALNNLGTAMARTFAPSVRVNTIMPGLFMTDIAKGWDMEAVEGLAIPAGRPGRPPEIVGAAVYLASDASSYTSGSVLKVDGGYAWAAS